MADKTITIKDATDKELDEMIFRLRKENEVQSLISDIKRKSVSGYMPYEYGQEISTEKPIDTLYHADKTKTIKGCTDKELDELLVRLRKENDVLNVISDMKRKSGSGYIPYDKGQEISTEKPIDDLYHFGILGMRWGRKSGGSTSSTNHQHDDSSEDHKNKMSLKGKKLHTLSNAELKMFNERLQLEKTFKTLTKQEKSAVGKFVTDLLISVGKEAATSYVKKYAAQGIDGLMKKATK